MLKVVQYLNANESAVRNLCLIAVLFLKRLSNQDTSHLGNSFDESELDLMCPNITAVTLTVRDKHEIDLLRDGLQVCQAIVTKALLQADEDEKFATFEVANWLNCCYYLIRRDNQLQNELYPNFYKPDYCIPSSDTFSRIKQCFDLCTNFVGKCQNPI